MAREDKPAQRTAWVRIHCDDGLSGIGEASPMQGGLASLGIVKHSLAPALIGQDLRDHEVLQDSLPYSFVNRDRKAAVAGRCGLPPGRLAAEFRAALHRWRRSSRSSLAEQLMEPAVPRRRDPR
jgi:hypothetical protein